jgi:type IV secretory pathway VirB10-like protein
MAMKLVRKTADYKIFLRGDNRYAVQNAAGKPVNGEEKVNILIAEELVTVSAPPAPEPEAVETEEEVVAEEAAEEEVAAEEPAAEEAPAEEPAAEEAAEERSRRACSRGSASRRACS